jgi:hypothetical protein
MKKNTLILFLASTFFLADTAYADKNTVIEVPTLEGEIVLDGVPDEAFWSKAATVELSLQIIFPRR